VPPVVHRHHCGHSPTVLSLLLCWHGIVALVAPASLPSIGATAVIPMVSFPLRWHHRPSCAGVCPFTTLRHVVVAKLASLPALHWHPGDQCTGVLAGVTISIALALPSWRSLLASTYPPGKQTPSCTSPPFSD
jgi:hypothetical protein